MSSADFRVLHTLRCIGTSSTARLAERAGLTASDTESQLIDLGIAGSVTRSKGPFGGWSITRGGRTADDLMVATELAVTGCLAAVEAAFERFNALNPLALEACSDWQLRRDGEVARANDHLDRRYDSLVLRRIASVERRGQEVCNDLTAVLDRFSGYGPRMATAMTRAHQGEGAYVSEHPDSFHSLWFQLHEDLLITLGRPRH